MKFVTVASFPDPFDANVMKFRLENEGIECFLLEEHLASIRPHLATLSANGVRLQVAEKDVEAAVKVLKEADYYNNDYPANNAPTQRNIRKYFLPIVLIIIAVLLFIFLLAESPWR
jgi:hypothetical protein